MRAAIRPFLLTLTLLGATAEAVEPSYMVVTAATPLMRGTEIVWTLSAGDLATVTERNGIWIWANVRDQEGWVKYGHLRTPREVEDFHRHADWLKWEKRFDEALALTYTLDSHYGPNWQTSYIRGDILRETKDPRAEAALEEAIALANELAYRPFPYEITPIYTSLSQLHQDQGKYRLAIADYGRAFGPGGIVALDKRDDWHVHLSQLRDSQARLWAEVGEYDAAVEVKRHAQLIRKKPGRFSTDLATWLLKARRPLEALDLCKAPPELDFAAADTGQVTEYDKLRKLSYERDVARAKAEAFAQCGRVEEAAREMHGLRDTYAGESPSAQLDVLKEAIKFWLQHGDVRRANEVFDEANRLSNEHPKLSFPRIYYLKELGRYAEAVAARQKNLEAGPTDVSRIDALAWHLATSSRKGDRNPKNALQLAERAIQLAPNNPLFYETKAAALAALGDFTGACKAQSQAIEAAPENSRGAFSKNLDLLKSRHLVVSYDDNNFLRTGDVAIVLYDEAALESDDDAEPIYVKFGERLNVIGEYKHFIAVVKDGVQRWIRRIEVGSSSQYLKRLEQKLKLDRTAENLLQRADEYLHRKEFELALKDVESAIELSPDNTQAVLKKAWILAACPLPGGIYDEDPVRFAESTAERLPSSTDARYVLAIAQAKQGRFKQAIETIERLTSKRSEALLVDESNLLTLFENDIPYVVSRYR